MTDKKKSAFTLAEIMIVLLVLTVLFAGFAPVVTKKIKSHKPKGDDMWQWSTRNYMAGPMDAYYDSQNSDNFGEVFFGVSPITEDDIHSTYQPYSKVVIRSGPVTSNSLAQRQLQLRHGTNSNYGELQSNLLMDTSNILFGNEFENLRYAIRVENIKHTDQYPRNNLAYGIGALDSIHYNRDDKNGTTISSAKNNVAVGYKSLTQLSNGSNNTSIGSYSGYNNVSGNNNTLIGYKAGYNTIGSDNVIIGNEANSRYGDYNTIIGYKAGNQNSPEYYSNNLGVGAEVFQSLTTGKYNVAIGKGALKNLTSGSYNVAIGSNACSNVTSGSYKTCIGANSGPSETNLYNQPFDATQDNSQRTYIGSKPKNFGGDAVLEIHNTGTINAALNNNPTVKSNTTTVINGNLIVRGQTFFTVGDILYPFYYYNGIFSAEKNNSCATNQVTNSFSSNQYCKYLNSISSSSDRRLKNIKQEFKDSTDKIGKINVYNYNYKADKEKSPHVGVIAQELQKIFPNAVSKNENGDLTVRWDEMFFSAINSIKELNKKIIASINILTNIEKKITKLEKENKNLETQIEILSAKVNNLKK